MRTNSEDKGSTHLLFCFFSILTKSIIQNFSRVEGPKRSKQKGSSD